MSASFKLTLDTLAPSFSANLGSGPVVSTQAVDLGILVQLEDIESGPLQFKIWGDVDPTDDPNVQVKEEDSSWVAYGEEVEKHISVLLSEGDGNKQVFLKVRDDVWNEAFEFFEVELNTKVPVITITSGPSVDKISKITGKDTANFTFKASEEVSEWKVEVVTDAGSTEDEGTMFNNAFGSEIQGFDLPGETNESGSIVGGDLQEAAGADGEWTIKIFGKSTDSGLWSL